jgi:molybdenum cofactor cytidylyltransferase
MGYTVSRALGLVETGAAFIVPVDMPNIKSEDFTRLFQEFTRLLHLDTERFDVLRPSFGGKPGHPVLIKGNVAAELRLSKDGTAVRTLLERFQNRFIEWDHPGVVQDLDTPADYEALRGLV